MLIGHKSDGTPSRETRSIALHADMLTGLKFAPSRSSLTEAAYYVHITVVCKYVGQVRGAESLYSDWTVLLRT